MLKDNKFDCYSYPLKLGLKDDRHRREPLLANITIMSVRRN